MPLSETAEALKAEGNALYSDGNHKAAIEKYTAAINIASDSAVLFANRAASRLTLEQYEQARQDARKATELDPKYAKGWGRLASALEGLKKYKGARDAYGRAIECIDATAPISDADKRLKAEYKSAHANMELQSNTRHFIMNEPEFKAVRTPWELAKEIKDELPKESSGHIIIEAAEAFAKAKSLLSTLTRLSNGTMVAQSGGIACVSNAILVDERCIFMQNGDPLVQYYNEYVSLEATKCNAWISVIKPAEVLRLARERLRQSRGDWNSVRDGLSCQVQFWIVSGYLGRRNDWSREQLYRFFDRACKLIELGRAVWPDVHRDDRGTIFDDSFLRGVQALRMNEYMQAYGVKYLRAEGKFTLDGLLALANEILDGIESTPPEEVENMHAAPPYFYLSFYLYPKAQAWSIRGFVYLRRASFQSIETFPEDHEWARKAGEAYIKAADLYPEDDEVHFSTLSSALNCLSAAKAPARDMLAIMERLRLAYPKMQRIWKNSKLQLQGGHNKFVKIMEAEKFFRMELDAGRLTLDDPLMLQIQP